VGNLCFVAPAERAQRAAQLQEAGVVAIVTSWAELTDLLLPTLRHAALTPIGGAR
jgi:hypothetical protein